MDIFPLTFLELDFLIGVYLVYNAVLVSVESAISIPSFLSLPPSHFCPMLERKERNDSCLTSKRLFLTHPTWKPQTITNPCIVTPGNLPNLLAVWKLSCPSYVLRSLFLCTRHLGFSSRDVSCLERAPLNASHPKFAAGR